VETHDHVSKKEKVKKNKDIMKFEIQDYMFIDHLNDGLTLIRGNEK